MALHCPSCNLSKRQYGSRIFIKFGFYRRTSDRRVIHRFKCKICDRTFSRASFDPCFRQLKRQVNKSVFEHLASGNSQRRMAYLLRLNRKTVKRKFLFLGLQAKAHLYLHNLKLPKAQFVQFDDLETFEHSKCKPLSVTLAVEGKSRRILGFAVSKMPAKGHLVKKSLKLYGVRKDERAKGRGRLFCSLQNLVDKNAIIQSDQNPHYPPDVKKYFPEASHLTIKGRRGAITGQGELKKIEFDPLFSLNHTCAKLRSDVNRLIRKTWCTTKLASRLELHLGITALYHNQHLLMPKRV